MPPPDPSTPAWRARERRARRADLLAAARAVFAERGYHAATVEEIASRAEIGKGTVYLQFPGGKGELLDAVLHDHLVSLRTIVMQCFVEGEGAARFRFWSLALAVASYFRDRPDLLVVHSLEVPRLLLDPEVGAVASRVEHLAGEFLDLVVPTLEAAGGTGALPTRLAAYHLLVTLFGALTALGLHPEARDLAGDASPPELADALTTLAFDGIRLGPAP